MKSYSVNRQKNICIFIGFMCIPAFLISTHYDEPFSWTYGAIGILCLLFGYFINSWEKKENMHIDPLFIMTFTWVSMSFISSIPLWVVSKDFPLSYFDTVSQITSTGTTIPYYQNYSSTSLNFWRSFLCCVGGIYSIIIIFSKTETDTEMESSFALCIICYFSLTLLCILFEKMCGLSWLDASNHGMRIASLSFYDTNLHDNTTLSFIKETSSAMLIISWIAFSCFHVQQKRQFLKQNIFSGKLLLVASFFLVTIIMLRISHPPTEINKNTVLTTLMWITGAGVDLQNIRYWSPVTIMLLAIVTCLYKNETNEAGITLQNLKSLRNTARKEVRTCLHPNSIIDIPRSYKTPPQHLILNLSLYGLAILTIGILLNFSGQSLSTAILLTLTSLNNLGISCNEFFLSSQTITAQQATLLTIAMWLGKIGFVRIFIGLTKGFSRRHTKKSY
ncbi:MULTISPECIES: hypothetical protein [Candidatus Ichthyocystis]|uniref:hypothetical protein n=1 Tax=Candidatus Ichthyocystis TaxID=2929841 RepID=UPI001111D127|nr:MULTISPECIES: hypothetical protein [Ichthyocystis]